MNTPPAAIRRLTPGDAAALVDFYNALSPASKRTFRPLDAQTTLPVCEAIVRDNLPAAESKLDLVAVDGTRVAGWSFVWDLGGPEPVFGLAVADDYHGRGLGSALMDAVLAAARQKGLSTIYLTVVRDNDKARGLYARRGFATYGAFTGQDGLPYFRMVAGAPDPRRDRMRWLNEPPTWKDQAGIVEVTTGAATDFWRRTRYGFIRDNGHCYYQVVEGDFVLDVKVSGAYRDLYDQAGVMLRLDDRHWMKCGIEYVHGVQNVSAVVTNEFSDWSVAPAAHNPPAVWLRVTRRNEAVEVHYSFDGAAYTLLRLAYLPPAAGCQAGLMAASPDGSGFQVVFEKLEVQPL
jgi:regulation of enolase protein 1 (concanavalin A-like superfamily)/GNAT superfamily N-acetyltransferase